MPSAMAGSYPALRQKSTARCRSSNRGPDEETGRSAAANAAPATRTGRRSRLLARPPRSDDIGAVAPAWAASRTSPANMMPRAFGQREEQNLTRTTKYARVYTRRRYTHGLDAGRQKKR